MGHDVCLFQIMPNEYGQTVRDSVTEGRAFGTSDIGPCTAREICEGFAWVLKHPHRPPVLNDCHLPAIYFSEVIKMVGGQQHYLKRFSLGDADDDLPNICHIIVALIPSTQFTQVNLQKRSTIAYERAHWPRK